MSTAQQLAVVPPLVKTIQVAASPARAFDVFTGGVGRWWAPGFSVNPTGSPIAAVVIEPREGGRWYERGQDGSECDWGKVLAWQPPTRLLIAWQVDARGRGTPAFHTEVEVRFEAKGDGTRVTLEHRFLERLGADAPQARQRFEGGWGGLLDRFAAEVLR